MPQIKQITFAQLIGTSFVAQLICIPALWGHVSTSGNVLGRYTSRYALVLVVQILLTLTYLIAYAQRERLEQRLARLPQHWRYGILGVSLAASIALAFFSVEPQIQQYAALNLILVGLLIAWHDPPHLPEWLLPAAAVVALPLLLFTVLTTFPFSPDEAHWADYASSAITDGGIHARTWLQPPYQVYPGVGLSVGAYGWALENISFDIQVGRVWNFGAYLLAFVGIFSLTNRLYGRQAALTSTAFAVLSLGIIPIFDYRPDHQIAFAAVWGVFAVAQGHFTQKRGWNALAGIIAGLSLQLHAIGIALVFGIGLHYVVQTALVGFRERRLDLMPLVWYCAGLVPGAAIYIMFNVQPVGDLATFLRILSSERLVTRRGSFTFLTTESLLEGIILLASGAFLVWRRQAADRLFLSVLLCLWLSMTIFDTQGYRLPLMALYTVPVGALIIWGFGQRRALAAACLAAAMVGQIGSFISWRTLSEWVETGTLPTYVYHDMESVIKPYLHPDDVILTTHLMIWALHDFHSLYSYAGELTAMQTWGLSSPVEVWERVQPTVLIQIEDQMTLGEGAEAYMEQHHFTLCHTLNVQALVVEIYRPDCTEDAA